eukprot:gnl/TRDRNA2_/TRDRNA2_177151_c5_seq3.p1 gnl/TRDRNA2_/TRDRNA2_177151_c5~~gnl/TRDRNA2_/TRDRNA2_177151_c5_seq3.p1  ORF type:complete len:529 (-),score=65.76 gnl/TRDRNA2_/TRDRNA2_177151_c5_seq3:179-1558(-)
MLKAAGQEVADQAWVGNVGATVLGGFSFILGFLIVFRAQQAYSRWWEGGTLLQKIRGEWFNAFSSCLAFCNSSPEKSEEVLKFQHQLARLVSLLYCSALHQVSTMDDKDFETLDVDGFSRESLEFLKEHEYNRCEVVLQWTQRLIVEANEAGVLKIAPPILSRVFNELGNGIVNFENARKITEFPIPLPLAQMITLMLMFHWIVTAVVCAASLDKPSWVFILSFVVVLSFWTINYIATELEMPFGDDWNDLPMHDMQKELNVSIRVLLNDRSLTVPAFAFKKNKHTKLLTQSTRVTYMPVAAKNRPEHLDGEDQSPPTSPNEPAVVPIEAEKFEERLQPQSVFPLEPIAAQPLTASATSTDANSVPALDKSGGCQADRKLFTLIDQELGRLNVRIHDHLCQVVRELQALRGVEAAIPYGVMLSPVADDHVLSTYIDDAVEYAYPALFGRGTSGHNNSRR